MTILITGGTGKTGSRLAQHLTAAGHPVRVVGRHTTPPFDWSDTGTWDDALTGCDAAYVAFQPDIGLPGADAIVGELAHRAVALGCRRLVLLSGRGEQGARLAEDALIASGADWTILRSAFFLQNFTEGVFAEELAAGSLTMVEHTAAEPFVDVDDVAAVAARVILAPSYSGTVHELTGPRLLSFGEVARAVGGDITYRALPAGDYIAVLVAAGLPEQDAAGLAYLFEEVLDGRNAHVTDGVAAVLGRPARDLDAFVADLGAADR